MRLFISHCFGPWFRRTEGKSESLTPQKDKKNLDSQLRAICAPQPVSKTPVVCVPSPELGGSIFEKRMAIQ